MLPQGAWSIARRISCRTVISATPWKGKGVPPIEGDELPEGFRVSDAERLRSDVPEAGTWFPLTCRRPGLCSVAPLLGLNAGPLPRRSSTDSKTGTSKSQIRELPNQSSQELNKEIANQGALRLTDCSIGVQWRKLPIRFRCRTERCSRCVGNIPLE
jgi:hypothetical protein